MFETTTEVYSTRKYILWFEQSLEDAAVKKIKDEVDKLNIDYVVISGVAKPQLVEFDCIDKGAK